MSDQTQHDATAELIARLRAYASHRSVVEGGKSELVAGAAALLESQAHRVAELEADRLRMRERIKKMRWALQMCAGMFIDADLIENRNACLHWAGDMEKLL